MKKPTYQEYYDAVVEDYRPSCRFTGEDFDRVIKENEGIIGAIIKIFAKA